LEVEFRYFQDDIDWSELSKMYRQAPLGNKSAKELETSFSNSMYKCFILASGRIIGAGRALADGVDCSYICDVAILPEYQGRGLGGDIISYLVKVSQGHKKIILYSVPGYESFYKKYGFMRMSTAMAIFQNKENALNNGLVNET
jgi:ribosomal protein S18 acetylase RimI-like enzyme